VLVGFTCLIVDDDQRFLAAAGNLLRREGVNVLAVASTGDEAVKLATDLRPDVALVDIDLGGESGFDVAKRLADLPGGPQPVVLISAYSEQDFAELVSSSTALGFVSKPRLSASAVERFFRPV
jgi:CheY-like chemotaxis protein